MQGGARLGCETTSVPCKMGLTKYRTSAKQIALYTHTAVKKITLWSKTIFVDVISVQNTRVYVCFDFIEHRRLC